VNGDNRAKYGDCLSEEVLTEYLEGALSPVTRNACEAHLIACDPCRRNLALFMRVLRDDLTPKEEIMLQRLEDVCEHQGIRAVAAPPPARTRYVRRLGLVYLLASVLVIVLLALGTGLLPLTRTPAANEITTALLSRDRPFEPRIAGAPYRPIGEVTRGPEESKTMNALADALEGRAQAYEMGQLFLIQKEYADAIRYLRTAVGDGSVAAAEVHNDLGVAYLQNGEATFGLAETEFKTALRKNPSHAPALFNLSILYEREGLPGAAAETWRQYLEVDPESGWAQEIRRKLEEGAVRQ
jgi:tetratricopeptide (TPR) repeat protein